MYISEFDRNRLPTPILEEEAADRSYCRSYCPFVNFHFVYICTLIVFIWLETHAHKFVTRVRMFVGWSHGFLSKAHELKIVCDDPYQTNEGILSSQSRFVIWFIFTKDVYVLDFYILFISVLSTNFYKISFEVRFVDFYIFLW